MSNTALGSIKIIITQPKLIYFINLSADDNITLSTEPLFSVATTITGSSKSFLILLLTKQANLAIKTGLEVSGNLNLAEKLQTRLFNYTIDWQAQLEKIFDPAVTYHIQQLGNWLKNNYTDFKDSLVHSIADYLLYENQLLVKKDNMDAYLKEIDQLRLAVDRIEARINNYMNKNII